MDNSTPKATFHEENKQIAELSTTPRKEPITVTKRRSKPLPPVDNSTPVPMASAPPLPTARSKRLKPAVPQVTFSAASEGRVEAILALVAAENKGGTLSSTRIDALRYEMHAKLAEAGEPCWTHGVDVALAKGAGWRYAVAVMRNNPGGAPAAQPRAPQASYGLIPTEPVPGYRRRGYCDEPIPQAFRDKLNASIIYPEGYDGPRNWTVI